MFNKLKLTVLFSAVIILLLTACGNDVKSEVKVDTNSTVKTANQNDDSKSASEKQPAKNQNKEKKNNKKKKNKQEQKNDMQDKLAIADSEIPFISRNESGKLAYYKINLASGEISSMGDEIVKFDSEPSSDKELLLRENFYWNGSSKPIELNKLGLDKTKVYYLSNNCFFVKDGALNVADIKENAVQTPKKILDLAKFYKDCDKFRENLDGLNILNAVQDKSGNYHILVIFELKKPIDKCAVQPALLTISDENYDINVFESELAQDSYIAFEEFDNCLNVDEKVISESLLIDLVQLKVKQNKRKMPAVIYDTVKKLGVDVNQPKYDGGFGSINGTYGKYQISRVDVSAGKFTEYFNFIFDKDKLIQMIYYKNGFISIYNGEGNVVKEYKDMKFDFMLFPKINQVVMK